MEKRVVLAIVLSTIILIAWSAFMPKPVGPKVPIQESVVTQAQEVRVPVGKPPIFDKEPDLSSLASFNQENMEVVFVETQAAIKEVIFKQYQSSKFPLKLAFNLNDNNLNFKKVNFSKTSASFVHKDNTKEIVKVFNFAKAENYTIDLEINVRNMSNLPLQWDLPLSLGTINFKTDPEQARYRNVAALEQGKIIQINPKKNTILNQVKFASIRDRYFCNIVEPECATKTLYVNKINANESEINFVCQASIVAPGATLVQKYRIYLGPEDLRIIKNANFTWAGVINYGFFDIISQVLLKLLEVFYNLVHSWGWAIIILSIAIYLILFPLTLKQMRSMKEMQALQPKIAELKKLYKDNPQKLHKETLELYKEHKVNPFGGCLPLLLQMPIFFALYQALIRSIALKGSSFYWIKDLSEPDRMPLPMTLPVIGNTINILPILMAILMFFQQKASLASTSSEYAEQQKIMLFVMPLMFGFIFYTMPAGLVLYWFVNSFLMAIYQFRMNRVK